MKNSSEFRSLDSATWRRTPLGDVGLWHFSDMPRQPDVVRLPGKSRHPAARPRLPFLTQPVWKRFSYPNEYKQPGVKDLDATI